MTADQAALFDGFEPSAADVEARRSAGRRITLRQREAVAAGIHPLTGARARPDLGTCGTCALRSTAYGYPKCTLGAQLETHPYRSGPYMTHGQVTDCRAWWPACGDYQQRATS